MTRNAGPSLTTMPSGVSGGLSTKIHHACDGNGRPLAFIIGPGQGSDSRMSRHAIVAINVPRSGMGRARTARAP
jgi:hypothetical protein